jgi:hypothetical protein
MKNCILEKLKNAAMKLHNVKEIFPAIHNDWRLSYAMEDVELKKYHKLEYKLHPEEETAHEIAINVYSGKTFQEELNEID